jgi:molybdenum cofactor cytidylyltransferase
MTGIIILAAGPSSRLGTPKQNLVYQGQTLLQRAVKTALKSACKPVAVVLGANCESIRTTIKDSRVRIIYNQDWAEGMASSIRSGIKIIGQLQPEITSVILMLCDQPFVDAGLLNELVEKKSKAGIVAASYNETFGPPALFDMLYFDDLLSLKGSEGAKKVIQKYPDKVIAIPFPQGSIDIDTMEDFEKL